MFTIEKVDTDNKAQVQRFIDLHYQLYQSCPQWVPPFRSDIALMLNRRKHPFYEHSTADFFIATRDGRDVGRIGALENRMYNEYHGTRTGQFYLFDCEDDSEAAAGLFTAVFDWARARNLDKVIGPKGFSVFDGYGILQTGFEHRQMMNMMNYNYPYYLRLMEESGFTKEVDFVSHYLKADAFQMPERIHRIAQRVSERKNLQAVQLKNKLQMIRWAGKIGRAYNQTFVQNWEYVPLTEREIKFILNNLLLVSNPRMLRFIVHEEDVVGFALTFPDISAAMQRSQGRLRPWHVVDLLREMKRTTWVSGNGLGMLPSYQGIGGHTLLYTEIEKTIRSTGYMHYELTQVAETAVNMRRDLENLGGQPYKNHRVFVKTL